VPIYAAKIKLGAEAQDRLVDAPNEARALKHIAKQHITLEAVRTPEQIKATAELAAKGVKVEVAEATDE
jgi:hypothetical protein